VTWEKESKLHRTRADAGGLPGGVSTFPLVLCDAYITCLTRLAVDGLGRLDTDWLLWVVGCSGSWRGINIATPLRWIMEFPRVQACSCTTRTGPSKPSRVARLQRCRDKRRIPGTPCEGQDSTPNPDSCHSERRKTPLDGSGPLGPRPAPSTLYPLPSTLYPLPNSTQTAGWLAPPALFRFPISDRVRARNFTRASSSL